LWGLQNLRVLLEDGITSVRDLGSLEMVPFVLKEWAAENRIPSPRLFVAGKIITGTGGHGTERPLIAIHTPPFRREASGPDDWRNAVREAFKRGADVIKISSHFSEPEARAAAEEAHALGLKITCDCETYYIPMAVRAGVDIIEHPLPRTPEAIQLMAEHGVASDPTLVVYLRMLEKTGGYYNSTSRRFTLTRSGILDTFARMKAAGIKMGIGTDTSTTSILTHGSQYLAELKAFVENGYTIPQALIAATRTGAEILDMQDKLGTLEPGKLADVLVVEGRPDQNLDDLKRIDLVIRDGYLVVEKGHVTVPRHQPVAF
jgi:imidazolonepropionase-like amidohydrolase